MADHPLENPSADHHPAAPQHPRGLPEDEIQAAQMWAADLIEHLRRTPDKSARIESVDEANEDVHTSLTAEMDGLNSVLDGMMERIQQESCGCIPPALKRLQASIDELDPGPAVDAAEDAIRAGRVKRALHQAPVLADVFNDLARAYSDHGIYVQAVLQSLEMGAERLRERYFDLEDRYQRFIAVQRSIRLRVYALERIRAGLDGSRKADRPVIAAVDGWIDHFNRLRGELAPFFITLTVIKTRHEGLRYTIRGVSSIARYLVENGAEVAVSAWKEGEIKAILSSTPSYFDELRRGNPRMTVNTSRDRSGLATRPIFKLQRVVRSYAELTDQMAEADQVKAEMIAAIEENRRQIDGLRRAIRGQEREQAAA